MWTAIIGVLTAAIKALLTWFGWKKQRELIEVGRAQERADASEKKDAANVEALKAREDVRRDAAHRSVDGVPDDDGFRRD